MRRSSMVGADASLQHRAGVGQLKRTDDAKRSMTNYAAEYKEGACTLTPVGSLRQANTRGGQNSPLRDRGSSGQRFEPDGEDPSVHAEGSWLPS